VIVKGDQALLIVRSDRPQVDPSSIAERDVTFEVARVFVIMRRHLEAECATRMPKPKVSDIEHVRIATSGRSDPFSDWHLRCSRKEEKDKRYHRVERSYGTFTRPYRCRRGGGGQGNGDLQERSAEVHFG
jgi:hypothetical protein